MMAAAEAERARATAEARRLDTAARNVRLLIGCSIVGAVAMAPISMLLARSVAGNQQEAMVRFLLGSALVAATGLVCLGIYKSQSLPVEPDGLSFQVSFGSAVLAGCGILTNHLAFIVVPLIPSAVFWALRKFRKRSSTQVRDGNDSIT
ncbi:hypothetical protein [Streptomyces sp. NPDC015242]|uniref:hypothetical protein n=1 Tax=Streptomyces sp. NPDC015242 TaxID=3364951 RepID=UPI0036F50C2A